MVKCNEKIKRGWLLLLQPNFLVVPSLLPAKELQHCSARILGLFRKVLNTKWDGLVKVWELLFSVVVSLIYSSPLVLPRWQLYGIMLKLAVIVNFFLLHVFLIFFFLNSLPGCIFFKVHPTWNCWEIQPPLYSSGLCPCPAALYAAGTHGCGARSPRGLGFPSFLSCRARRFHLWTRNAG